MVLRALAVLLGLATGVAAFGVANAQCGAPEMPALPTPEGSPTPAEAARFLTQTSFGPTHDAIDAVVAMGYAGWIDDQMALDHTSHRAFYANSLSLYNNNQKATRQNGWWNIAVNSQDQLRQRVAFALSQIFVVSELNIGLNRAAGGMSTYYDILVDNAFGNYRDLLEKVTLSPVMGRYLSMLGNPKPNVAAGLRADENYAREIMQLFSIGLVKLEKDGTPILGDDGVALPTYGQPEVENLARTFTGWSFKGATVLNPNGGDFDSQMVVFRPKNNPAGDQHDTDAKTILGGTALPAGQTAEQDLKIALDTIASHPNVAPFFGKLLIQRLVTSNPTPAYVARVAAAFDDSGGNLGATVKAILLDPEARQGPQYLGSGFGKVREPVMVMTHLWRAFHARPSGNNGQTRFNVGSPEKGLDQAPYRSPSVFNFFQPQYQAPFAIRGVDTATPCMTAPELQLADESNDPVFSAYLSEQIRHFAGRGGDAKDAATNIRLHFDEQVPLVDAGTDELLDDLNLLLMSGQMTPEYRDILRNYVETDVVVSDSRRLRISKAVYMIMSSPQYLVQR